MKNTSGLLLIAVFCILEICVDCLTNKDHDIPCTFRKNMLFDWKKNNPILVNIFLDSITDMESYFVMASSQTKNKMDITIEKKTCKNSKQNKFHCPKSNLTLMYDVGWTNLNITFRNDNSNDAQTKIIQIYDREKNFTDVTLLVRSQVETVGIDFKKSSGFVNCFSDVKQWYISHQEEQHIPLIFDKGQSQIQLKTNYLTAKLEITLDSGKDNLNIDSAQVTDGFFQFNTDFYPIELSASLFSKNLGVNQSINISTIKIYVNSGSFYVRTFSLSKHMKLPANYDSKLSIDSETSIALLSKPKVVAMMMAVIVVSLLVNMLLVVVLVLFLYRKSRASQTVDKSAEIQSSKTEQSVSYTSKIGSNNDSEDVEYDVCYLDTQSCVTTDTKIDRDNNEYTKSEISDSSGIKICPDNKPNYKRESDDNGNDDDYSFTLYNSAYNNT